LVCLANYFSQELFFIAMDLSHFITTVVLVLLLSFSAADARVEESGMQRGPLWLLPSVELEVGRDNNVLYSNANPSASWVAWLRAGVQMELESGPHRYDFSYGGEAGRFFSESQSNYFDNNLAGGAHWEFSHRSLLDLDVKYADRHEARGTAYSIRTGEELDEPDEISILEGGSAFTYGGEMATGRVKLDLSALSLRQQTRRDLLRWRDRDRINAGLTFFYRVMPKTSLLFEFVRGNVQYLHDPLSGQSLDSVEQRYLFGVTWDITGLTTGTVKVGSVEKDFEADSRQRFNGLSWDVVIEWAPLSYSYFQLTTSTATQEPFGESNFIDERSIGLSWLHAWSNRVDSEIGGQFIREDYEPNIRRDKTWLLTAQLNYAIQRLWQVGFKFNHQQRSSSSSDERLDFSRRVFSLLVKSSF